MKKRTGIDLNWHQLQHLKTKDKNNNTSGGKNSAHATATDRLLADLKADPEVSFVCLFGDVSSGLLTIKTKRKNINNSLDVDQPFLDDLGDSTDSPQDFARDMTGKENLIHTDSGQMLLAIAWTNNKARRKFDMYPEFMGGDDTEDTNAEKRPLYTLMGKDNNNLSFGHTWCFMPSKALWVFRWIIEYAVPELHPGTATKRVELIASDADPQETKAIEMAIKNGVYPNAHHRHCAFHKMDRNLKCDSKYRAKFAAARDKGIHSRVEVDMVLRFMWYFCKHYENNEQVDLALLLLDHYLKEDESEHFGEIGEDLRKELREFITKSFVVNREKLFEASFEVVMTIGNCTTGINEAMHRVYKKHCQGPLPQHDIAESACRINLITDGQEDRKAKKVAFDNDAVFAKEDDRNQDVHGLSDFANKRLLSEYNESMKYLLYRSSSDEWLVKRDYDQFDTTPQEDLGTDKVSAALFQKLNDAKKSKKTKKVSKSRMNILVKKLLGDNKGNLPEYRKLLALVIKYVVPRFENTRRVRVKRLSNGELVLVCSCRIFIKYGHACRCMYKVLKRAPILTDAKPRWHDGYALHYGVIDTMSSHYLQLRDTYDLMPGIPITQADFEAITHNGMGIEQGDAHVDYFMSSMDKLKLRGSNTYWHDIATKHPQLKLQCYGCTPTNDTATTTSEYAAGCVPQSLDDRKQPAVGAIGSGPFGCSQAMRSTSGYMVPSQQVVITSCTSTKESLNLLMQTATRARLY